MMALLLLAAVRPPAASGTSNTYKWIPGVTTYTQISGTSINTTSGCGYVTITLPFPFTYRGSTYSTLKVSVEGATSFSTSGCLPGSLSMSNALVPWGNDLMDDATSTVEQLTTGSSPNRVLTIQWKDVKDTSYNIRYNFQLKLYEGTNAIEFVYGPRTISSINMFDVAYIGVTNSSAGGTATGNVIEGRTGLSNPRSYRAGDFPPAGTFYRFTPEASAANTTVFDPLASYQWHIKNTGQYTGTAGEDANVTPVWSDGNKGEGIRIAVVDDGMALSHEDLTDNVLSGRSYNYLSTSYADVSASNANHGTAVAGVVAAKDGNGKGGRGIAPGASIFGFNLLQSSTSTNEADAMSRDVANVDVSNNSWGPADGTGKYVASTSLWKAAVDTGLSTGRGGKGTAYVWAAGNGGASVDNANYDGYANYYGVIAICAVGDRGVKANYSEEGANLWVCGHSQGDTGTSSGTAITTTDNPGINGYNTTSSTTGGAANYMDVAYTNTFNGTSSAAPLVGGVVALIMKANANLTWRDIKLILAESARKNNPTDTDWTTNAGTKAGGGAGGYSINHKYGFGTVDAQAAVNLAKTWTNVGSQVVYTSTTDSVGSALTEGTTGITRNLAVAGSGVSAIEFVQLTLNMTHPYACELDVVLTGPSGTVSTLAKNHGCGASPDSTTTLPGNTWTFGSSRHLGEAANGTWTLTVKDTSVNGDSITFTSWNLKFFGR